MKKGNYIVILLFLLNNTVLFSQIDSTNKSSLINSYEKKICNCKNYYSILDGLNHRALINKIPEKDSINEYIDLSEKQYFESAVYCFFNAEKDIIDTLLKFENDRSLCSWVYYQNPYDSYLQFDPLLKDFAARILIHNFLLLNNNSIRLDGKTKQKKEDLNDAKFSGRKPVEAYKWQTLKTWLNQHKNLSKSELQKEYKINPPKE